MSDSGYLTPEEAQALKDTFRVQTEELLESFGVEVLKLERDKDRPGALKALSRIVHTIKGDSMALELERLAAIAHRIEDYLETLSRREGAPGAEAVDALFACADEMTALLAAYCAPGACEIPSTEELLRRLDGLSGAPPTEARFEITIRFARECTMRAAGAFLIRRQLEAVARVVEMRPDPDDPALESSPTWKLVVAPSREGVDLKKTARVPGVVSRIDVKPHARGADAPSAPAPQPTIERDKPTDAASADHLRVEAEKIDRVMDLVGELVIGRSMMTQAISDLEKVDERLVEQLDYANAFLERMMGELQTAVLKIRMVAVDRVFRRLPRLVRELAQACGKEVELDVQGGTTELDKGIVDSLSEPLLHLVRNAVDHGIETPAERRIAEKPPAGRLKISAAYESQHVHIVVEDDGRGIDVRDVSRRAVELGLLSDQEAQELPAAELLQAIYLPGLTTRESVSTVSGRGIGMDVVREAIQKLKGTIEIQTEPGRGTRFLIRLPLTLAILRAILVETTGRVFAIPLTEVLEILRLPEREAATVLGRGVLPHRDRVVPLVSLNDILGYEQSVTRERFVLLVGEAERRAGLVVDRVLGEHELVVKPLESAIAKSPGIAGASVLGNGRVVLIVNLRGLLETWRYARRVPYSPEPIGRGASLELNATGVGPRRPEGDAAPRQAPKEAVR